MDVLNELKKIKKDDKIYLEKHGIGIVKKINVLEKKIIAKFKNEIISINNIEKIENMF